MSPPRHIMLVAGEASGDRLGAALMRSLRAEVGCALRFSGVGGESMLAEGLEPVFPMRDIAVMGIAEVVPHIPRVLHRLGQAADAVATMQPDALVTIDAQVFSAMLARRARRRAPGTALIQYVAPTVWAWKPWRARKAAALFDRMLTLFPFEPPYFEREGLRADCVGHPLTERLAQLEPASRTALRTDLGIDADAPLLLIAPGSRRSEIARLSEPFGAALAWLSARCATLEAVLPVAPGVAEEVEDAVTRWPVKPHLLRLAGLPEERRETLKFTAFAAADAALAASGTVTLELAGTRTPTVIGYRASPLTEALLRRMMRIDTGSLVNIILDRKAVPEFFQANCNGPALGAALQPLLRDGPEARAQRTAFDAAFARLGKNDAPPPDRAARAVLDVIAEKQAQRFSTAM